jgi:murein DD-endopeptidase MepM/ murein hydrolase activator NlpD
MTHRHGRGALTGFIAPWTLSALLFLAAWAAFRHVPTGMPARRPGAASYAQPKPEQPVAPTLESRSPVAPVGTPRAADHSRTSATLSAISDPDVAELRSRHLPIPVEGIQAAMLVPTFDQARDGRKHEALDILAPRGTPAIAVEDGRVAKLFTSARGGLTVYLFDPSGVYCYYYAHLDSYADNLREGQQVVRGETIGYVGTTGNAPANTPHLHFAVAKLGPEKHWWQGTPIDPFLIWR